MRLLLVLALLGGCVCEGDHLVDDAYATKVPYGTYIDQCITKHDCDPLCVAIFDLGPDQDLVSCRIEHVDAQGTALVEMRSVDTSVCAADDNGASVDDTGDDTGDDGTATDGSDDGSTDGTDDGTTDGTDDGSTDDGSTYRRGSTPLHAPATHALVSRSRG